MNIKTILEKKDVLCYLESRRLVHQYQKAKKYLLLGHYKQVDFKLRKPKAKRVYSFRINKKFRALCVYKSENLIVFDIDNHQN